MHGYCPRPRVAVVDAFVAKDSCPSPGRPVRTTNTPAWERALAKRVALSDPALVVRGLDEVVVRVGVVDVVVAGDMARARQAAWTHGGCSRVVVGAQEAGGGRDGRVADGERGSARGEGLVLLDQW